MPIQNKDKLKNVSQYLLIKAKITSTNQAIPVISAEPKIEKEEKGKSSLLEI